MRHILNTLAAIVFGLLVSVEYVGATSTQELPSHVGNLSPMLSNICVGNANLQAEERIKGVVQMMKFARVIGRSEVSCLIITSFDFDDAIPQFIMEMDAKLERLGFKFGEQFKA